MNQNDNLNENEIIEGHLYKSQLQELVQSIMHERGEYLSITNVEGSIYKSNEGYRLTIEPNYISYTTVKDGKKMTFILSFDADFLLINNEYYPLRYVKVLNNCIGSVIKDIRDNRAHCIEHPQNAPIWAETDIVHDQTFSSRN